MPKTTSSATSPTFESIDLADLLSVQGGCGKKQQCCSCAPQAVAIAAAPAPAAAAAAPIAPPPPPSVETSVSVSYQ